MSKLKYYTSPLLNEIPNVKHAFFTRIGGQSEGIYEGLNCGLGSDDDATDVHTNLDKVAVEMGVDYKNLLTLYQTHGTDVVDVDKAWRRSKLPKADGAITDKAGFALGIKTADCAPILFASAGRPCVASVHSGWKGARHGILNSVIASFKNKGIKADEIVAVVGPCIGRASYEVSNSFVDDFLKESAENEEFFIASKNAGHMMFDLSAYIANKLYNLGVEKIGLLDLDTYSNESEFYSYRRMTHRKEADYGRQISVICLKN